MSNQTPFLTMDSLHPSAPRSPLTEQERDTIRAHYPTMDRKQLMTLLPGRSWNSIRCEAQRLKVSRTVKPKRRWPAHEDKLLADLYPKSETMTEVCAQMPGRSRKAIRDRAHELGLQRAADAPNTAANILGDHPYGWTADEFRILMELYPSRTATIQEIMASLPGRSSEQIRRAAYKAGLRRPRSAYATAVRGRATRNMWTPSEDRIVLSLWKEGYPASRIKLALPHRTEKAIEAHARLLVRREKQATAHHVLAAE